MKRFFILLIVIIGIALGATLVYASYFSPSSKKATSESVATAASVAAVPEPEKPLVTHVTTPKPVKAVYMSSWVAASPAPYKRVIDLIETTEVNAVVIDIKDATGKVSFLVDDPIIANTKSPENRIKNVREFINTLHAKNIYVIGRISTFQDDYLAKVKPEWALKRKSDGSVWKDKKGLPFLDPANPEVAEYLIALGRISYYLGFDEINYDYIRYPSDGNVKDINYQLSEGRTRADNLTAFAEKLHTELKKEPGLIMSADVFGLTTTEKTDMGIGQVFERLLPYFDYIAPMIYPSHYANGEYGIKNPSASPYETITKALAGAKKKTTEMAAKNAVPNADGTMPNTDAEAAALYAKVRPWLQDFSIRGTTYDAAKIIAQKKATYDAGLDSWMMWDPANKYTAEAYNKQ